MQYAFKITLISCRRAGAAERLTAWNLAGVGGWAELSKDSQCSPLTEATRTTEEGELGQSSQYGQHLEGRDPRGFAPVYETVFLEGDARHSTTRR